MGEQCLRLWVGSIECRYLILALVLAVPDDGVEREDEVAQ